MSTLTRLMAPCLFLTALAAYGQSENLQLAQELANDASAVEYPYNPDADASGQVGAEDLIELFIYFGNPLGFQISDDDMSLPSILELLAGLLVVQQEQIASLEEQLQGQEQAIASLAPLLSLVPVAERSSFGQDTWNLSGLNVRLDNGAGTTYGASNGLGNLILGYNESEGGHRDAEGNFMDGEVRVGSHNLVVGAGHTYGSNGSLLGGYNNSLFGQGSAILSGQASLATGTWSAILGGLDNRATATNTCISGGHSNTASGDRASVSGGLLNISAGIATSILGGQYMQVSEQYETASGQYNIND
ncbi:MAG TPA: hypothetical protein DEA66_02025 [Flavobacteriales bacterium]|nr:hypothetical protein [Flavobacteriales bacterium]